MTTKDMDLQGSLRVGDEVAVDSPRGDPRGLEIVAVCMFETVILELDTGGGSILDRGSLVVALAMAHLAEPRLAPLAAVSISLARLPFQIGMEE